MLEELHNLIKRKEENEAYYKALFEGFSKKLSPALAELVFLHWTNFAEQRNNYEKPLLDLGDKYAHSIWEDFNNADWLNNNKGPMAKLDAVPLPGSDLAEAEMYCKKLKEELSKDCHKEVEKLFWEEYKEQLKSQRFKYAVYQKMKAVFTEFYIEDILEFESHILRYFDRSLYLMCTLKYVDEVYSLN